MIIKDGQLYKNGEYIKLIVPINDLEQLKCINEYESNLKTHTDFKTNETSIEIESEIEEIIINNTFKCICGKCIQWNDDYYDAIDFYDLSSMATGVKNCTCGLKYELEDSFAKLIK